MYTMYIYMSQHNAMHGTVRSEICGVNEEVNYVEYVCGHTEIKIL